MESAPRERRKTWVIALPELRQCCSVGLGLHEGQTPDTRRHDNGTFLAQFPSLSQKLTQI